MNTWNVANTNQVYDGGDTLVNGTVAYVDGTKTATFTQASPPLAWGTRYTARISTAATDIDLLTMQSAKVWTFTTTMPVYPIVVTRAPAHGDVGVLRGTNITATLSKDIDASSVVSDATCLVFTDANGNNVYDAGDTLFNSVATRSAPRVITINPTGNLVWNTVYTVNLTTGIRDTDGLYLQSTASWYFTVETAVNPVVSNTVPAPDATGVLPSATVNATFSKDMKETETELSFTLTKDSDLSTVAGTAHYDTGGTRRLTFTPSSPLVPGEKYTAVVHGDGAAGSAEATDGRVVTQKLQVLSFCRNRPSVLLKSPADSSVGISRSTTIKAVFSKGIDPATVTPSTFLVKDGSGGTVPGTVGYDALTFTATFTPDAQLAFASYSATIKSGAAGIKDPDGIELASDVTWTFTTVPSLTEPVAANNKIVPGGSQKVTIFIPQPPAGAGALVTVQVFTATGKRVATLVNNQSYSSIVAGLPLLWDGTNGRAQKLGPGLYFIRITATGGYSRVLKVMIVR
jgi:hypothetical protein